MRKLLNTLYVTTPESYLARDGENIVVRVKDQDKFRIPVHNIEGIVCFGYTGASPALMGMCAERNVGLSFLTENGYFLSRVGGRVSGNVLLRRKQYRIADNADQALSIAKLFITGKIANCRSIMQRAMRDHEISQGEAILEPAIKLFSEKIKQINRVASADGLRGIEGECAQVYFGAYDHLILYNKDTFYMRGRNRRPPKDNVNALLSFLYTLLMHDVQSALETVGLDPCVGFLHTDRPGRPGLALDMMEEFRPYLADRMVLTLINRKQIDGRGFQSNEGNGVIMNDETRKEVLTAWQKRKQEEIVHPYLQEKIPVGLLPYSQALLMARFLRGDIDNYPVFLTR
jgi:CRISPR-associated protein Cas1